MTPNNDANAVEAKLPLSEATKRKNPHLWPEPTYAELKQAQKAIEKLFPQIAERTAKRLRQSTKPVMNKLEQEWFQELQRRHPTLPIHCQAIRFKLCNGVSYTPDMFAFRYGWAWEVKGKHTWDDAIVKLKMAARIWPEITWTLAWKENGQWQTQQILP